MIHSNVVLTDRALSLFERMSHDANPLHKDPAYARRTPFGSPVAYGMLGVLTALRPVLERGPVRLLTLRCGFPGALYRGAPYEVTYDEESEGVARVSLLGAQAKKVQVDATFERCGPHASTALSPSAPTHEVQAPDPATLVGRVERGEYAIDIEAARALDVECGLNLFNLSIAQIQMLAWMSYSCGMLVPGRQSLIGSIDLTFPVNEETPTALRYSFEVERFDSRFGSLRIAHAMESGGQPAGRATITAFARPAAVGFSTVALKEHLPATSGLQGQTALVTGAGRGLGAYLAGMLGLCGAHVVLNYRSEPDDAESVIASLRELGVTVSVIGADVGDAVECARLVQALPGGRLDILVNNASPAIVPLSFGELGEDGITDFVSRSLAIVLNPVRALLPSLRASKGMIVAVSSEYVCSAPARFSHYVAAKLALEGVMHTLSNEEKDVRFLVPRIPRLLTDQTNTNFDLATRLHPAAAAAHVVAAVARQGSEAFRIMDVS